LAIPRIRLPVARIGLAISRILLPISPTLLALLWPIILPAILMWAVMSAVLMMSCTHENCPNGLVPRLQPSNT
jgi:hypothetical protein